MFRILNKSNYMTVFTARFMLLLLHLIWLIILIWDRTPNVLAESKGIQRENDSNYLIWLGLSIGFLGFEMISFLFTLTSFIYLQSFISIIVHSIAVLSLFGFYIDSWPMSDIRWIFGFCTVIPTITELISYLEVFIIKKF